MADNRARQRMGSPQERHWSPGIIAAKKHVQTALLKGDAELLKPKIKDLETKIGNYLVNIEDMDQMVDAESAIGNLSKAYNTLGDPSQFFIAANDIEAALNLLH